MGQVNLQSALEHCPLLASRGQLLGHSDLLRLRGVMALCLLLSFQDSRHKTRQNPSYTLPSLHRTTPNLKVLREFRGWPCKALQAATTRAAPRQHRTLPPGANKIRSEEAHGGRASSQHWVSGLGLRVQTVKPQTLESPNGSTKADNERAPCDAHRTPVSQKFFGDACGTRLSPCAHSVLCETGFRVAFAG